MGFTLRNVKDRLIQYPRRYKLTQVESDTYDLEPVTGEIIEEGTAINKAYLQPIENTLYLSNNIFTLSGSSNIYTLILNGISSLADLVGIPLKVKAPENASAAITININSYGAVAVKKPNGNSVTNWKIGGIYTIIYDGSNFILQGEGGEYGTAGAAQVLSGYTIGTENGIVSGTMPNQGAKIITPSTVNQAILEGYHNGLGYVKGDANLVAGNIKQGVTIFGKTGTFIKADKTKTSGGMVSATYYKSSYSAPYTMSEVVYTLPANLDGFYFFSARDSQINGRMDYLNSKCINTRYSKPIWRLKDKNGNIVRIYEFGPATSNYHVYLNNFAVHRIGAKGIHVTAQAYTSRSDGSSGTVSNLDSINTEFDWTGNIYVELAVDRYSPSYTVEWDSISMVGNFFYFA